MKQDVIADMSWSVVLWLFRCFCITWTAIVVMLAARGFVMFIE